MDIKIIEIRDEGTFIPVVALRCTAANEIERYYLRRCGYPLERPQVILANLNASGSPCWSDPYGWHSMTRTMRVAHIHILDHWDELETGSVVDVEVLIGTKTEPKVSERFTTGSL